MNLSYRESSHLRELTLEGKNLKIDGSAFAGLTQIDFFNLFGILSIGTGAFENVSRIHRSSKLTVNPTENLTLQSFSEIPMQIQNAVSLSAEIPSLY